MQNEYRSRACKQLPDGETSWTWVCSCVLWAKQPSQGASPNHSLNLITFCVHYIHLLMSLGYFIQFSHAFHIVKGGQRVVVEGTWLRNAHHFPHPKRLCNCIPNLKQLPSNSEPHSKCSFQLGLKTFSKSTALQGKGSIPFWKDFQHFSLTVKGVK